MRLIDADALIAEWCDGCKYLENGICDQDVCGGVLLMKDAPTIEAEPVKHGNWLWDGKHYYCSVCSGTRYHDLVLGMDAAYCPYCGAKLGGVEDGKK